MNFAQTLDKMMKERNISNYEMSKKTGISDSLIGYWRKGERVPKADNLLNIANFLECSVDYLLGRTDEPQKINYGVENHGDNNGAINNQVNSTNTPDGISKEMLVKFEELNFIDKVKVMSLIAELSEKKA